MQSSSVTPLYCQYHLTITTITSIIIFIVISIFLSLLFTDPTWGTDGFYKSPRVEAAKFTLKYYDQDDVRLTNPIRLSMITAYDRCKANRRCNWGIVDLDQFTNDAVFYQRLFDQGELFVLMYVLFYFVQITNLYILYCSM